MTTIQGATHFIGPYEILGLLGKGGMGSVYLGRDTRTETKVAVKLLSSDVLEQDDQLLERLKREGEALRMLNHPNIVKIIEVVEDAERYALVLEYVEGGTLRDLIVRQEQLPVSVVLKIALELADALTRAHHLKIIHRDIKPANIMFAKDGTLRLTDFGLARMELGHGLTKSGMVLGSIAYLSPEAIDGQPPEPAMDIWAFGVVLYEMLAGRPPFNDDSITSTLTSILMDIPADLLELRPDTPSRLVDLINQMLTKDKQQRIASVRRVAAELEEIMQALHLSRDMSLPQDIKLIVTETPPIAPIPAATTPFGRTVANAATVVIHPSRQAPRGWLGLGLIGVILMLVMGGLILFSSDDTDSGPTSAEILSVEPVADNELMILVAHAEPLGDVRPTVDRFVRENLADTVALTTTMTSLQVREYPSVITSAEQAHTVAMKNGAAVVVWGNYDESLIELNISLFTNRETAMPTEILEQSGNLRVRLIDERRQSIAPQVLIGATVWYSFHGYPYEAAATMVAYYDLDVDVAEVVGATVGANVYYHFENLYGDTPTAVDYLDSALQLSPNNPMLYHLRGAAIHRTGNVSEALQNVETAQLLSERQWSIPFINAANILSSEEDYQGGIDQLTQAIALQPNDWLYYAVRGSYHYLAGDLAAASLDLEASIERNPKANFPYILLMNIAIQDGRIELVQSLLNTSLARFPDPTLGNRIILTAGNEPEFGGYYALTLSAFNNLVLRQYDAALRDISGALALRPSSPDLYLFQGVIYCIQSDFESAEAAYTKGLRYNTDMTVLYLLRADARNRLGNAGDALGDFSAATSTAAWENFAPVVEDALGGGAGLGCESFFAPTD